MKNPNGTNPLAMASIFAAVFGIFFFSLKLFVFLKTGEITQRDIVEVTGLTAAIFIGAFCGFYFRKRK